MISIIVPIYNVAPYLRDCLDSIVNQTYSDIEIICVNDGSTDESADIVRQYMKVDTRISIVEQENKGLSGARNTGLLKAKGEYVYFMDSDDMLEPTAMETCYRIAEEYHLDVVSFDACSFMDDGYKGKEITAYDRSHLLNNIANQPLDARLFFRIMLHAGAIRPSVWLSFIRRELVEKHHLRFEEKLIHEDELFTPQLYILADKAIYIPRVFFHRRIRGNSIMTSVTTNQSVSALCHIIEELMIFARQSGFMELISWRCNQLLLYADTQQKGYIKQHLPTNIYLSIRLRAKIRNWKVKLSKY